MMIDRNIALPTPQQIAWHDLEIGMFIHWAPNVYHEKQYDSLLTPLQEINPAELDTDQWVDVACSLGAKYIIMVAKHAGGFCTWQTDTCDYGIKNTPWRGGQGDIIRDLSESCRKRGVKLGVYLSPYDLYNGARTGGVCATSDEQKTYDQIYRRQLTELLTRYGEIVEVWFDGSCGIEVGDILKKYVPEAMIFQSPFATIRWVGNEDGIADYPAWNSLSAEDAASGVATNCNSNPDGAAWLPLECDTTTRADWFWSTTNHVTLKSLDKLMKLYYSSVGNGAVLLLNANPDRTGRIPAEDSERFRELGDEIRRRFSRPIAEVTGSGYLLELDLGCMQTVDHIILMEDIAYGERVRTHAVDGWDGKHWIEMCSGTAIGHKRIVRIKPERVSRLRFRALESVMEPKIRSFAAYYTGLPEDAAMAKSNPGSIVVGEWGPELLRQHDEPVELDIDLTGAIAAPGQYSLRCAGVGGNTAVESVKLYLEELEYPNYVSGGGEANEYVLYISGMASKIAVKISLAPGENFRGSVLLTRL